MDVVLQDMFTIIFIVEFIVGTLGNGFITLVNGIEWVHRRKISAVDQILTALAISRILLLGVELLDWYVFVLYPAVFLTRKMIKMCYISWTITNHFNIWLATCLSLIYLFKIANFSNSVFCYLRWRVGKVVSTALLLSVIILVINILVITVENDFWIDKSIKNSSYTFGMKDFGQFSWLFLSLSFIFTSIPFSISSIAFVLLISSLWKHLKNMQNNMQTCRDASTMAHIKALQMLVAFLLLYSIFFLSLVVEALTFTMERSLIILLVRITLIAFPSGHSCVVILGNGKLKEALIKLFHWLRSSCKDAEPLHL